MIFRNRSFILTVALLVAALSNIYAQTIFFEKPDNVSWSDSSAYIDSITTDIGITRDYSGPIFNGFTEEGFESGVSPEGTLWAWGPTPEIANPLTYAPFDAVATDGSRNDLPGSTMSLFIIEDSLFFDIEWTSWSSGNVGGFAYNRTSAQAPVFDNDPDVIYFRKDDYADNDSTNWDRVSANVAIWRDGYGSLYNPITEEEGPVENISPEGTYWAYGSVPAEVSPFHYSSSFYQITENNREYLPGEVLSMYVMEDDSYWDVEFTSWSNSQNGGGFAYIRRPVEPVVVGDSNAVYFQKLDYAEYDEENFDWITEDVAIWRNESGHIYNAAEEDGAQSGLSPTRTLWANGPTPVEASPIHYAQFGDTYPANDRNMRDIVGQVMSLYIPDSNLYFDVEWFQWTSSRNGGGFAYSRTPASAPVMVTDPDVVYFRNLNYADVTDPEVWDVISDSVAITRGSSGPIFNPIFEEDASNFTSPARTSWAPGATAEQMYLSNYTDFLSSAGGRHSLGSLPGRTFSLYVEDSDTYFDVTFISWKSNGGGGFAYMRTEESAPEFMDEAEWTYYLKPANTEESDSSDWDWISTNVALYRDGSGPLYNAALEEGVEGGLSPAQTFWTGGFTPTMADPFTYVPFQHLVPHNRRDLPGSNMSLMVIETADTSYYDVQWLTWTSGETGGFSYLRRPADAPTYYQDPDAVYFIKYNGTDGSDPMYQDMISDSVALTSDSEGLYNAVFETSYQRYLSPTKTLWANGPTADQHHTWEYVNFQSASGNNNFNIMPGQQMSLWLPEENLFFDIEWAGWTYDDGGFAYIRRDAGAPVFDDDPMAVYFIKDAYTPSSDSTQWDRITENVAITRDQTSPIFNPILEESYEDYVSPTGTRWAMGSTAGQVTPNAYAPFGNIVSNNERRELPGRTLSLFIPETDQYFDIHWITWTTNSTGGFSYVRTPAEAPDYPTDPAVVHFIKHDYADPHDSTAQDRVTPEVWITRGDYRPLFNAYSEESYSEESGSPEGTRWALGSTADQSSQWNYSHFEDVVGDRERQMLPGQTLSLFIPADDLYFDIEWLTWKSNGDGGGFSYRRTEVTDPFFAADSELVYYMKEDYAVLDSALLWDSITDSVAIYRGNSGPLYNPIIESEYNSDVSPAKTLWARGLTEDVFAPSQYQVFDMTVGSGERQDLPGKVLSLWLPEDSLFFDVRFLSWSGSNAGGFSYFRRGAETPEAFTDTNLVFFEKENYSDHEDSDTWDWISNTVAISRGYSHPIYNAALETEYEEGISPELTLWSSGPTADVQYAEAYVPFDVIVGSGERQDLPGRTLSLFLMDDSVYYDVTWLSWSRSGEEREDYGAGFSYVRRAVDAPSFEIDPDLVLFTKPDGSPNELPFMDMISPDVIITRGDRGPIYNAALETEFIDGQSPTNTLWTYGLTADVESEYGYRVFDEVVGSGERRELPGRITSLYLPEEDRYFDIEWLSWSSGEEENENRGFSYLRREVPAPDYEINPTAILFEKPDGADPADSLFWDGITPEVAITRGADGPIFNPHTESVFIPGQSPTGTFWALGSTDEVMSPHEYTAFDLVVGNGQRRDLPGKTLSLWIPEADLFFDIEWISWSSGSDHGGREAFPGFSYLRTPVDAPMYFENMDMVYFMRDAYASGNGPNNIDHISENVAITRGNDGGYIYNAYLDFDDNEAAAPTGTFWARGLTSDQTGMDAYAPFGTTWGDGERQDIPGQVSSLYVEEMDAFYDVYWRSWGRSDGGTFSYIRIPAGHLYREADSDWMDTAFQDRLSEDVALTRLASGGALINADTETAPVAGVSPEGTLWVIGHTQDQDNRADYMDLKAAMNNRLRDLPGQTLSMFVTGTGLYYDVYFADWGSGGGAVEYFRSWAPEPAFVPHAPEAFEIHPIAEPVVITNENVGTDVLSLTWDEAMDADMDVITYHVEATLDTLLGNAAFIDSMIEGTTFDISYQLLVDEMEALAMASGELTWTVTAMDNDYETPASNGPLVIQVDASTVAVSSDLTIPETFALEQNYPNPFNPSTTIRFGLPEASDVHMVIYDIKGRQVQALEFMGQQPGWHEFVWNGKNTNDQVVSTGMYFCRLQAGSYSETIKMVYLK